MLKKIIILSSIISLLIPSSSLFAVAQKVSLSDEPIFDQEFIISDHELTNYQSMSVDDILKFLKKNNGVLDEIIIKDTDGKEKTAAEIIFNASQEHKINPKIVLAILQKEQSLITQKPSKKGALDWAMGFGATDHARPFQRFKGFAKQIQFAAWRLRYFIEHPWEFKIKPNQTTRIDRKRITPKNLATAALYNYTPHIRGNKSFWKIWNGWFRDTSLTMPEGSVIRAEGEKGIWLIQNGARRPYRSKNVFTASYSFDEVRVVSPAILYKYPEGLPMGFPNYSLLQSPDNKIYLLVDGKKRHIVSMNIFKEIGFKQDEILQADTVDLAMYDEGESITTPYPTGNLVQDQDTKAVYFAKDDFKYPLIDKSVLEINFPYRKIIKVKSEKLALLKTTEPMKLKDGLLIKDLEHSDVYLTSLGQRRPIISEEIFEALGFSSEDIITVPASVVALHPLGEPLIPDGYEMATEQ
ncbi:MAG: exo-alpha-sialidase [Parcubacteria group bacterium]|nr:exo-alpha-sialidase [Parcubacteria group bacterium]